MIKRIQIENFKSFGKVDLEPHPRVNLLIGPNSSGKSNFLEALQFGKYESGFVWEGLHKQIWQKRNKSSRYGSTYFRQEFEVDFDLEKYHDHTILFALNAISFNFHYDDFKIEFESYFDDESQVKQIEFIYWNSENGVKFSHRSGWNENTLVSIVNETIPKSIRLFRPNPIPLKQDHILTKFEYLNWDLREIPVLINSLQNAFPENYQRLCKDLHEFTKEFKLVTSPSSGKDGHITLNFFDDKSTRYSIDEISEGILLFTAFLAILHQPNPPKVILLEEPENGIHPRRIVEIYNLITKLAEEKDVQFFITTHSPILLNQFSESPECVWVFDKVDGISQIKNLKTDILDPRTQKLKEMGVENPGDLTDDLGENWMLGLIDGVPPSIIPEDF